jgi:hypothetical protein
MAAGKRAGGAGGVEAAEEGVAGRGGIMSRGVLMIPDARWAFSHKEKSKRGEET